MTLRLRRWTEINNTHDEPDSHEQHLPPCVLSFDIARGVTKTRMAWDDEDANNSGYDRAEGEEHRERRDHVLLALGHVFEQEGAICWH